jgi:hypothetical protein
MVDNSAIRDDEKNEKNKEDFGVSGPRIGETITLRDAAVALLEVAPSKKKM